jgi:UDP-GlcNAc3NAcA epimerase
MYDAALYYAKRAIPPQYKAPYAIATLHRAENTDDPRRLRRIMAALGRAPLPVLVPLHPRTRKMLACEGIPIDGQLQLLEPQSYFAMLGHLQACAFVITDSGGLQKEAYYFGKQCITVRDETEWVELVECGANRVVGTEEAAICGAFAWAMQPLSATPPLYGRGDAGKRIVELLTQR